MKQEFKIQDLQDKYQQRLEFAAKEKERIESQGIYLNLQDDDTIYLQILIEKISIYQEVIDDSKKLDNTYVGWF